MSSRDTFTKQATQVLDDAQEEARYFNHPYVGTEHILLGLIRDQDHVAGKVLDELGVKHAQVRSAVEFIVGHGEGSNRNEDLELTASAKKIIEYALEEAHRLNDPSVSTEHLLLGLVRKGEGVAAGVLEIMGVNLEQVRPFVLRFLRLGQPIDPRQIRRRDRDARSSNRTALPEAGQRTRRSRRPQERERPEWVGPSLFEHEARLQGELHTVQARATEVQRLLEMYHAANVLPWLSEDAFATAVPRFFASHLGIAIDRDHHDHAAFWITDAQAEKVVLVETMTYAGALKKGGIYALYQQREAYDLDPDFPALLVVNTHTQARSWEEKLCPIARQDYEVAANDKVLIVRIEDVLCGWHAMVEGQLDHTHLITLFRNAHGWLEVHQDGTFEVHP